ncbi:response regulator [Candidatus Woesearchaeota archaeon]|nr:response regulator [Candidatus Woesearchaeota archaeon]
MADKPTYEELEQRVAKLSKQVRDLTTIQNTLPALVYVLDPEMRLTYWNKSAEEVLGYSPSELDNLFALNLFSEKYHQIIAGGIKEAYMQGQATIEADIITKSGREISYSWIANSTRNEQGGINGIVGIGTDITERKKTEKIVLESERLNAIGELASGVAHDLNNPLHSILGSLECAMIEHLPDEAMSYLNTAKSLVIGVATNVQQLQRFTGKITKPSEYKVININNIVEDVIAQTRILWKDKAQKEGLAIVVNANYGDDVSALGNQEELRNVMYNIIKNSVQAMPEGGTIDIDTKRESNQIYLTLTDTGEGMNEKTRTRIFQPYYTTKGFELGTGLGMSTAYSIIKEHKGEIYVKKSAPGNGTSIEILLPYTAREVTPEKDNSKDYEVARVLWVDDENMIRSIGKRQLEKLGHDADVAASGQEALECLANKGYDLMITDIGMPGMDGWQLTEQIKGKYDGMKIAIISGWGAEVEPEKKRAYGIDYALQKPTSMDQLKNLVVEVMQTKTK